MSDQPRTTPPDRLTSPEAAEVGILEEGFSCSHDGYSKNNTGRWCDFGCGTDFNRMIPVAVVKRADWDALLAERDAAEVKGWDEGREDFETEIVCSVCGQNHDRDESAACEGSTPVMLHKYLSDGPDRAYRLQAAEASLTRMEAERDAAVMERDRMEECDCVPLIISSASCPKCGRRAVAQQGVLDQFKEREASLTRYRNAQDEAWQTIQSARRLMWDERTDDADRLLVEAQVALLGNERSIELWNEARAALDGPNKTGPAPNEAVAAERATAQKTSPESERSERAKSRGGASTEVAGTHGATEIPGREYE